MKFLFCFVFSSLLIYSLAEDCYDLCPLLESNCSGITTFFCNSSKTLTIKPNVSTVVDVEFGDYSSQVKELILDEGITEINPFTFSFFTVLENVTFPTSLKSIGKKGFSACSSISSISLPEGLNMINESAFSGCTSLKTINIPKSVSYIGAAAFRRCGIQTFNLDIENQYYTLKEDVLLSKDGRRLIQTFKNKTEYIVPDGVTAIEKGAFESMSSLTSIEFPDTLEQIGNSAFAECDNLKSITLGNSVHSIGNKAFRGCSKLSSASFGNSLATIGEYAFDDCISLTSAPLPDSVSELGVGCFSGCISLKTVKLPKLLSFIASDSFYNCSSITSITVTDSIEHIDEWAFGSCANLTSVTFSGSTLINISDFAFAGCNLNTLNLPSGLMTIADWAFAGNLKMTSVSIPESVSYIGDSVFAYCTDLTEVVFYGLQDPGPESIDVFYECKQLERVTVPLQYESSAFCGMENLFKGNEKSADQKSASSTIISFAAVIVLILQVIIF